MQQNYEKILEKISSVSGVEKEEIDRRVEAKRAKLSGLISREGAAQVVAAELGISFDNERLKIEELLPGMRKVNLVGKIINSSPARNFNKNGKEGKVLNFVIADETSNVKVVLWDTNHIGLIENGKITEGSIVEIYNASVRDSEVHLGSFSELKLSDEIIGDVKTEKILKEKNIFELRQGDAVSVRAFIVQAFEPKFFEVCPECRKKTLDGMCDTHGKISPEKRAILNMVIDDGTETMRSVFFSDSISKLGLDNLESTEGFLKEKENLLGKEMIFSGNVRMNKFFNNIEFIVDNVEEIDIDKLIEKLEIKDT